MGIPSLFSNYYRKFKKEGELLILLKDIKNVDYLLFDYNSLIHPAAYQILSANEDLYLKNNVNTNEIEKDIINNCIIYTKLIINSIKSKKVFIMIDGVAPRSKMNQQRERRYKSYFFKEIENKSNLWDSNKITPGTDFMNVLTKELHLQFPDVIISDSNEPGEGEHKMMKMLSETNIPLHKILIYGLDADLIMLSLLNKYSDNIILIRDTKFGELSEIDYLNIKQLKQYIFKDFNYKFKCELEQEYQGTITQFIDDYILLCFMLGNDFLDHLFCIKIRENGIDIILKAYIKAYSNNNSNTETLVNKQKDFKEWINLKFLKNIFYQLKNYEGYYLKQNKQNFPNKDLSLSQIKLLNEQENNLFFYDNLNLIETNLDNYKNIYYTFYNIFELDNVCLNYIEGLYWVLGYYNNHIHNNWSWYYKYHTIPFCNDIFNYLNKKHIDIDIKESKPFTQDKQLLLVLPRESFLKLNKGNTFITNNKNIFPCNLFVDLNFKEYLWQSKILFDDINDNIIDLI